MGPDLLQGRYADPKTTPLKVEMKEGTNNLEPFDLRVSLPCPSSAELGRTCLIAAIRLSFRR